MFSVFTVCSKVVGRVEKCLDNCQIRYNIEPVTLSRKIGRMIQVFPENIGKILGTIEEMSMFGRKLLKLLLNYG